MVITKSSFHSISGMPKRPLMIGSSGGAGHNSGIQGLFSYLKNKYGSEVEFPMHQPTLYSSSSQRKNKSPEKNKIETGIKLMNAPVIGKAIKTLAGHFLPALPSTKAFTDEIDTLNKKEKELSKGRFYIDMLLDAFPAGYESVAIWNVLQRNDKVDELKKLINFQSRNDQANYQDVYTFYYDILMNALSKGTPYTEIISSQAMALPAICDAVIAYNNFIDKNRSDASKIIIHEYVIELPTSGAVYYFQGLSKLTAEQQKQMKLYAVNMNEDFISHFSSSSNNFSGLYDLPRDNNPLVRPGFTNPQFDNSNKFSVDCSIALANNDAYPIAANEQIASIMLGSQAGNDTVEYIESLLQSGMDKVFVFGGQNAHISERIDKIIQNNPFYADKIIRLGNQGDKEIAGLMTRSNLLVIRAGALSTQEQLAMQHNPLQSVFIHHANSQSEKLTSGLAWEDANADALIADLTVQNVHTAKTSPERAYRHFAEARLISLVKKMIPEDSRPTWDTEFIAQHIRTIPNSKIDSQVRDLANTENINAIFTTLEKHLEIAETTTKSQVDLLISYCMKGKEQITYLIKKELGVENRDLNIEDILQQPEIYPALSHRNSKCFTLLKSYKAIVALLDTLSPTDVSASKKLRAFKEKFESKENKKDLSASKDNFLLWLSRKISNILAKLFPSIIKYISKKQSIEKQLTEIINETNTLNPGLSPGNKS